VLLSMGLVLNIDGRKAVMTAAVSGSQARR
jgi:hypothetical protein